jgi:hypothetical protein
MIYLDAATPIGFTTPHQPDEVSEGQVTQEGSPSLAARPPSFEHVLGDARLRDLKPELEQFAANARRAASGFSTLIRRINTRSSVSICGRPPCWRDFQRQEQRKPAPVPTHECG